jgi:hypothetical protein
MTISQWNVLKFVRRKKREINLDSKNLLKSAQIRAALSVNI